MTPSVPAGLTFANYKVESEIGRGGMGVVYRAMDVKLGRQVAIKVLPPALTGDAVAKSRLMNEARAACRLDSRHICTVYQVDETPDGLLYIVMAYYEGETLSAKIARGPLPAEVAMRYALQMASGLAMAHEAGIVHRDIKPANVLVDKRDEVKILDFGLARALHQATATLSGSSGGTPAYMAPEQIRGEPADPRADIWALGVVLTEMLTGKRPFRGEAAQVVMFNILHTEPLALRMLNPGLSSDLERVVMKALAKNAVKRYQSVRELQADLDPAGSPTLRSPGGARAAVEPAAASILVLPFDNMSPDANDAYFSDGLTDEIITDLSGIQGLRVISRTSAMRLKGSGHDIKAIGRELGVRYVLEGSVRKFEGNFRITAKLVDAVEDSLIWADKYGGSLEDVFHVQETLSRKIVDALKLKLDSKDERRLATRHIHDVRAYDGYLRAKQEMLRYSTPALDRALEYLLKSEKLVGDNILLAAAIGQVHWQYVNAGASGTATHLSRARHYAEKVRAIDPESPHCYRLLGLIRLHEGDMVDAIRHLKLALDRDPGDVESMAWLIPNYALLGFPEMARPIARQLIELDPLTPIYRGMPGLVALMAGDFAGVVGPFREAQRMDSSISVVPFVIGHALALDDRKEEACQVLEELHRTHGESFFAKLGEVLRAALDGDADRLRAVSGDEVLEGARGDPQYSWAMADCLAMIDDKAQSVLWVENAIRRGMLNWPLLAEKDPFLKVLWTEPAYQALMDGLHRRWEEVPALLGA